MVVAYCRITSLPSDMVGGIAKPKQADSLPAKVLNPAEDPEAGTSVLLASVLNNINSVYITLSSKNGMSLGELEIIYKKLG